MSIIDKIKAENNNLDTIKIYGDKGIFVHAYEQSAYAMTKAVKVLQTKVQYNRQLKMQYVSVGLPEKSIAKCLMDAGLNFGETKPEEDVTLYEVRLDSPLFTEDEFLTWKRQLIEKEAATQNKNKQEDTDSNTENMVPAEVPSEEPKENVCKTDVFHQSVMSIMEDILSLQLADYTPMMALNYLSQLQKQIRDERIQQRTVN